MHGALLKRLHIYEFKKKIQLKLSVVEVVVIMLQ